MRAKPIMRSISVRSRADAHLRPRAHGRRPGATARGTVARPRRGSPRGPVPPSTPSSATGRRGWTRGFARASPGAASSVHTSIRPPRSRPCTRGEDIVVVTPTASGKSLRYTAPVLQALTEDPSARALFLFPTKALGQDQVAELSPSSSAMPGSRSPRPATTATPPPRSARPSARPARSW